MHALKSAGIPKNYDRTIIDDNPVTRTYFYRGHPITVCRDVDHELDPAVSFLMETSSGVAISRIPFHDTARGHGARDRLYAAIAGQSSVPTIVQEVADTVWGNKGKPGGFPHTDDMSGQLEA
jgi:hypothetical protein